MISDDDLSCSICENVFTDPRVLPSCGHSFCCECIANWRKQSRECPVCRGDIGPIELPRNIALAGLVIRYKVTSSTAMCNKCFSNKDCRRSLCPMCTQKHVEKLRNQLMQQSKIFATYIDHLETDLESTRTALDTWTQGRTCLSLTQNSLDLVQKALATSLEHFSAKIDKLNSSILYKKKVILTAKGSLSVLEKTSTFDTAAMARGIAAAIGAVDRLPAVAEHGEALVDVEF